MIVMFFNALLIALREIRRNIMRAFLTVLGIIIGVSAVITMVTLGNGATKSVKDQISNLGSNLLVLMPGAGFGPRASSAGVPNFSMDDVRSLADDIPNLKNVAPVCNASLSTIYMQNARSTSVTGTTLNYFEIGRWSLDDGRFFTEAELKTGGTVCVIGATARKNLFGDANPIGLKLRIGKTACTVIGTLKAKGQSGMGRDQDDTLVVPITTLQRRLTGKSSKQSINQIMISAEDGSNSDKITSDIGKLMRIRRNLQPNEDDNFSVIDTRQIADTVSSSTKIMTTLLGAVAGVSLLVGGIGIMNIMLVSVTERTREIGIRMAIGARAREVLLQFLVEAITLSTTGGVIGMALAFGLCMTFSKLASIPYTFDPKINLIAFVFSGAVGVLFGFMPARNAARLDPIDALRHE